MVRLVHVTTLTPPELAGERVVPVTGLEIESGPGAPVLYAMSPAGETVLAFSVPESGAAQVVDSQPFIPVPASRDNSGVPVGVDLVRGGHTLRITLDTAAAEVLLWQAQGTGPFEEVSRIGAADGLGIATPTHVEIIEAAGQAYAVVGSAGSSSLSVLEISDDGQLIPCDHVIDDLETRFSRVTSLETVTLEGRAYVLAGGADDGITLFELLPGGRLLQLDTVADTAETGLSNVVALAAHGQAGALQVFAGSEQEAGVTQFSVGFGTPGTVQLATAQGAVLQGTAGEDLLVGGAGEDRLKGGAGRDVLMDGAGADWMQGGAGADVFVLAADDALDTIADFDPEMDRIDLSAWAMLRSTAQLTIAATADGARITFGEETLVLHGVGGAPLDPALLASLDMLDVSRIPILPAVLQETFEGTADHDTLEGNAGANSLRGRAGNDRLFGQGGADRIEGGNGTDWLEGGADDDHLSGGGGADTLFGQSGDDILDGNAGDDLLRGGSGDDTLTGGQGNDEIQGAQGNDLLRGMGGSDRLEGGDGADRLEGGDGNDFLFGEAGDDMLNGGIGFDWLEGGDGADTLIGLEGYDSLFGGAGDDHLSGNAGNDTIEGGAGNDLIEGGIGADILRGGADDDEIFAADGFDTLFGGAGDDQLSGNAGNDLIEGGAGRDALFGGQGIDILRGGDGDDILRGETGFDDLDGGAGNDTVQGGEGNDRIAGGAGNDMLTGGIGADVFVFDGGMDTILDMSLMVDRLEIDGDALGIAGLTGAQVIDRFAEAIGSSTRIVFDADNRIDLQEVSNLNMLGGLIDVI